MKTQLLLLLVASSVVGCSGAVRSPEDYRDDTGKLFETKAGAMKACYDDVLKATPGASGTVTAQFRWSKDDGALQDIAIDPNASTAPAPVQECVVKSLAGLTMTPIDAKNGVGSWTFEFHAPPPPASPPPTAPTDPVPERAPG